VAPGTVQVETRVAPAGDAADETLTAHDLDLAGPAGEIELL